LRRRWKVQRDTAKRGYTREQVLADLDKRERDSTDFIRPQKAYADMVVRFQPPPKEADDAHLDASLTLYMSLAQPDLTRLVSHLDGDTPPFVSPAHAMEIVQPRYCISRASPPTAM
jgi:phosphoribulokinase